MSDIREIATLPIQRSIVDLLARGGFKYVSDLNGIKPLDLVNELGVANSVALEIITALEPVVDTISTNGNTNGDHNYAVIDDGSNTGTTNAYQNPLALDNKTISAKDLFSIQTEKQIVTFCRSIDDILGGGVSLGQMTELCGVPGIGKTQLAIQLALDVQIPEVFGGLGGEAIYIDTEGSFMIERVANMAEALSVHLKKISKIPCRPKRSASSSSPPLQPVLDPNKLSAAEGISKQTLLNGIIVFRVHDQTEQVAVINHLHAYLSIKPRVKVVVIDSIAFHFRQDLQDTSSRNRLLSSLAQLLYKAAYDYNIAVVTVNHVTTKIERVGDKSTTRIVPALGDQWSHSVTSRMMMQWQQGNRIATLVKSPSRPNSSALYQVCESGIRDLKVPQQQLENSHQQPQQHQQQQQYQQQHQQQQQQQQQSLNYNTSSDNPHEYNKKMKNN